MTTIRITTIQDVIDRAVVPALGDFANDYDVEAIAREAFAWRIDTDGQGRELLNTGGFEQVVSDEAFWEIAKKHEKEEGTR